MITSNTKKYCIQYLSVFIANLAYAADSMQEGWISPASQRIIMNDSSLPISPEYCKWIGIAHLLGKIIGVFFSFFLFKNLSRKLSLRVASVPVIISWLANLFAGDTVTFLSGKFIGGIGSTMMGVIVVMYIGEISDPYIRGVCGLITNCMWNIGVLFIYIITPLIPLYVSSLIGLGFTLFQMILNHFIPESPYYLLSQNEVEKARKNLEKLTPYKDISGDMETISEAIKMQLEEQSQFLKLFTEPVNRKAFFIVTMTILAQALAGTSIMSYNVHLIFYEVGGKKFSELSSLIYQSIMVLSCLVSLCTVFKFGRKSLMTFSCFSTALTLTIQAGLFLTKNSFDPLVISLLIVANLIAYVIFFRIGLGLVPNVLLSELFAINVKVAGCTCGMFVSALGGLLANSMFHFANDAFGIHAPFWIFAAICAINGFLSYSFIPETRGKTLEEIQRMLANSRAKEKMYVFK